jgi:GT2 family glycosyltransferase
MSSDVTPNSDAINKIIKYAETDKCAGIIGCASKLRSGKFESNTKRFSDPMWLHCLHGLIGIIKPIYNQKEKWYFYNTEKHKFQGELDIDVVQDSFIWINGDLIARGLRYDTQFKLYYTEDDICYRIRKMGYKVICLQDAEVRHTSQATANQRKKKINSIYTDDALRFCYKYYGVFHWLLLKCDVVMMSLLRNLTKRLND